MNEECKVTIDAGVCKMKTIIYAKVNPETRMVNLNIESDCASVLKMSLSIKPVCQYSEIESSITKTEIYKLADEMHLHAACPVPCAIIKAVEVAGGLGLKRNVTINIE